MRNAVSRSLRKSPQFAGIFAGSDTGHAVSAANEDRPEAVWGLPSLACLSSLASEIRFPVRGEGRGQRLGLHATETGLHAGDSRPIGLGYDVRRKNDAEQHTLVHAFLLGSTDMSAAVRRDHIIDLCSSEPASRRRLPSLRSGLQSYDFGSAYNPLDCSMSPRHFF